MMTMTRQFTIGDLALFNLMQDVRNMVDDFTADKFGPKVKMTAEEFADLMEHMAKSARNLAQAEAVKAERSKRT